MFGGKLGLPELAVIAVIALLIFGPKKLGELGKGLGEGIRNFKSSMSGESSANNTTLTKEVILHSLYPASNREGLRSSDPHSFPFPDFTRIRL